MNPENSGTPPIRKKIRLGIDPGAGRGLEYLHRRADGMIDQDDFCFFQGLESSSQHPGLHGNHAQQQDVVTRQRRANWVEPPCHDHQADRNASKQTGPGLLRAEAEKFIEQGGPATPRHEPAEQGLGRNEPAQRCPVRGHAGDGP